MNFLCGAVLGEFRLGDDVDDVGNYCVVLDTEITGSIRCTGNFTPTPPLCLEDDEDGTDQIGAHSEAISEYNNSCGNA